MNGEANPWSWTELDRKGAHESWSALAEFVEWLVTRFDLGDVVPPCWWTHGPIVEELTALWAAWLAAYSDEKAEANAPIEWMEHLASCRTRLVEWDKMGCAQRGHRDGSPAAWNIDRTALAVFVDADLARRPGTEQLHFEIAEPGEGEGEGAASLESKDAPC